MKSTFRAVRGYRYVHPLFFCHRVTLTWGAGIAEKNLDVSQNSIEDMVLDRGRRNRVLQPLLTRRAKHLSAVIRVNRA
jgi:hypothetical protein